MALILNIDTATETASVCISLNGSPRAMLQNDQQREHASFVHVAIKQLLQQLGHTLGEMDAFAVTSGPGSYTGLRVGLATAKGFCYALSKPLITINTLEVMAQAAIDEIKDIEENTLFCPMIDARRTEVFTALYDKHLQVVLPPAPMILDEKSFDQQLAHHPIVFFGSGSKKLGQIKPGKYRNVEITGPNSYSMAKLAENAFLRKDFADTPYSQPNYLKDFHIIEKKVAV